MYSKKVGGNISKACSYNLRVSVINTAPVCRVVRGLRVISAKKLLNDVLKKKRSINGKYYIKSTEAVLKIIESAEKNAEFKNYDLDKLYIAHIAALDGTQMHRRRHKTKLGSRLKAAHLEIILKEKSGKEKEIPKQKVDEKPKEVIVEKKEAKKEEVHVKKEDIVKKAPSESKEKPKSEKKGAKQNK